MAEMSFRALASDDTVVCRAETLVDCVAGACAYYDSTRIAVRVVDETNDVRFTVGIEPPQTPAPPPPLDLAAQAAEAPEPAVTVEHPAEPFHVEQEG